MKLYDPEKLIKTYPRIRPALSTRHKEIYESEYKLNRQGSTFMTKLSQKLESWMHAKIAAVPGHPVLEIGAGTLNHPPYEPDAAAYDIVEPFRNLYLDSPNLGRIRNRYDSIDEVSGKSAYSRIISVATLEHIVDLPRVLSKASSLLADAGVFQTGIPCEGGFLWGLAWRMTTGITYRLRTGISYGDVMRHEHVNTCPEILTLVNHYFRRAHISYYPLPFLHGGFYAYVEACK